jgi:crossover junction endodeoxyribonuclease RusA
MKKEAKELKASYERQARKQYDCELLEWELTVSIDLYFGDKRKRDWDNWNKLSTDALTGIVWVDDSQIKTAHVYIKPIDRGNPRIELTII